MIEKKPICPGRIRKIAGSFGFIDHAFLRKGFFNQLTHRELAFYCFLILVADRNGLSYYGYEKICKILKLTVDEYIQCRDRLIDMDLVAFESPLFQVLSLPADPVGRPT